MASSWRDRLRCWWRGYHVAATERGPGWWVCRCGLSLCYCAGRGVKWRTTPRSGLGTVIGKEDGDGE